MSMMQMLVKITILLKDVTLVIVIKVLIDHGHKARKEVKEARSSFLVKILYLDSSLLSQRATFCILYFVFVFSMTNRKILGQGKGLRGALLSQGGKLGSVQTAH